MSNSWFFCPKPLPQARVRLFCFPYAGGGTPVFHEWPAGLPGVEVWMARLPGRGSRLGEEPLTRMLPLVQALARHFPHDGGHGAGDEGRPFAFFGHSLGARISFELARAFRRQRRPQPVHLFLSACAAPQLPPTSPPIHTLPTKAFLAELEQRGGTPQELFAHPELLELLLPMLRADFAVYETAVYYAEPPLGMPVTVFGGREDHLVSSQALEAWAEQTTAPFAASYFAGGHFYLRTAGKELWQEIGRKLVV